MVKNELFQTVSCSSTCRTKKPQFELSFGIAERIHEVLSKKGLTQKDLAKQLHKRESEISKWLTGRHNFTMQTIAKIETALDCQLIKIAQ